MKFSQVPVSEKRYLNYIFLETQVGEEVVTTMFDTRGNTLLKQSIADKIDIDYIDDEPIDKQRGWRRARTNLRIGGLEIGSAPIIVAKDESFGLTPDPLGNDFPADMILGWNIISQLSFRANLKNGMFEIQVDDFKEPSNKNKQNTPVLYVDFEGEKTLAALDSSSPFTSVSQKVFDKMMADRGDDKTIEMLGLGDEKDLAYETILTVKIDEDTIKVKGAQLNPQLNDRDVDIIFGADLLWTTSWALYSPNKYFRAKQG